MAGASLEELGERVKAASHELRLAHREEKDAFLRAAAQLIRQGSSAILEANALDLEDARGRGTHQSGLDRLALDPGRVEKMAAGLEAIAELPDPVGEVVSGQRRPNGLRVEQVRVPLGVVGIIYENRPNVTAEAAGLCVKAGNAAFLRGSSSALRSNRAIVELLSQAAEKSGLPADSVVLVERADRASAEQFVQLSGVIDCLIPRGGRGLVSMVKEKATVPYVLDGEGNCHLYVHARADLEMARRIVYNAKVSRPSVCNAAESLLVDAAIAAEFLPSMAAELEGAGVELLGDERARSFAAMGEAGEADFAAEFLGPKLAVAVVEGIEEAIAHIRRYSSGHSEAIITSELGAADRFVAEVEAAAVLVNASTRFVDGGELGLGAEVGISTQKLHARGPMGLRELTSVRYVIYGEGQVRT